jgi:uncharacterized membrane protein
MRRKNMALLSTSAWVAHNLGLAVGVGGTLFGQLALEPSVGKISDPEERGKIVNDAWRRFGTVQLSSLGVMAATWFVGRIRLTGGEIDDSARGLVVAKDVLVGVTLASAVGAAVAGNKMAAARGDEAVPMNNLGKISSEAAPEVKGLARLTDGLGWLSLAAGTGVIALTTILSMSAGKSGRWSVVSRFLP